MQNPVRYLTCAALLGVFTGASLAIAVGAGGQEGVQQHTYQKMTPAQRAAATRAFLGLGAVPDRAAAERGAPVYARNCAFCHGPAAHGATGPSLITSDVVLGDDHGEHLVPFLKQGRPEKGMPAFATVADQQLGDVSEFLHVQVEDVANRGAYEVRNIVVGDPIKGKTYIEGHCTSCHSAASFEHIASRFRSAEQLQRDWIWPAASANINAVVKTPGQTITGKVIQLSDFRIALIDGTGKSHLIDRGPGVSVEINDALAAHERIVMTLGNDDMHNVTAYLETLK